MTHIPSILHEPVTDSQIDNASSLVSSNDEQSGFLAQLLGNFPDTDLALFGGAPVRSRPYPQWPVSDDHDEKAVLAVLRSGQWGGAPYPGPYSSDFADQFVQMQGGGIAVLMANGSVTMEVALRAAQIGWGDEVIVPAYTFQSTATAPIAAGAIPVIVDVDPQTYCISPKAIEAAITHRTRAIIPVHLGAQMADMDMIMAIAEQNDLVVIEDCAHAHGAKWNGKGAGTFGHFGSFSLQSSKILTTGEGGVLLCRTQELAERATSLINCGRLPVVNPPELKAESLLHDIEKFEQHPLPFSLGTNYRMTEFQAALGIAALERFADQVAQREEMLCYLETQLQVIPGVRLLKRDRRQTCRSFYRYIFAIDPTVFGASHEEVCLALHAEGIPCSKGYPALHRSPFFQPQRSQLPIPKAFPEHFDFEGLTLPNTEQACDREAIWLDESIFRAGPQDIDDVIKALTKIQNQSSILTAAKQAYLEMKES